MSFLGGDLSAIVSFGLIPMLRAALRLRPTFEGGGDALGDSYHDLSVDVTAARGLGLTPIGTDNASAELASMTVCGIVSPPVDQVVYIQALLRRALRPVRLDLDRGEASTVVQADLPRLAPEVGIDVA